MATTTMTITEAMAEIKHIPPRVEKMKSFVVQYFLRVSEYNDPLAGDGGTEKCVRSKLQAIKDLQQRQINLRLAVLQSNLNTVLTLGSVTMSVQGWLEWRRSVKLQDESLIKSLVSKVSDARNIETAQREKARQIKQQDKDAPTPPVGVTIALPDLEIQKMSEDIEKRIGELDGKLSLLNATTNVTIQD